MSMTPGPWRVTRLSDGRYCIGSEGNSCDVAKGVFREPDARAIAALPEMVNFLRAALPYIRYTNDEATAMFADNIADLLRRIEGAPDNGC